MRIGLIVLTSLFLGSIAQAQNTGLYGKKFCIEVDANGSIPVFGGLFSSYNEEYYKDKKGTLELGNDYFDYGIRTSVSYAFKSNLALGIEVGMDFSNLPMATSLERTTTDLGFNNYERIDLKHEMLSTRTFSIIPKVEFTTKNGLLPIGLNHQIGVGVTKTKIAEKEYAAKLLYYDGFGTAPTVPIDKFYDFEGQKAFTGIVLLYALNVRTPITEQFMITYGVRYTGNFLRPGLGDNDLGNDDSYWYTRSQAFTAVKRRRNRSFISLSIGCAVAL